MWQRFTEGAKAAVLRAQALATEQQTQVDTGHICLAVLEDKPANKPVFELLKICGVPLEEARLYAQSSLGSLPPTGGEPKLTRTAKKLLQLAADEARRLQSASIGVEHIFIGSIRQQRGAHVGQVLRPLGLDAAVLREHLRGLSKAKQFPAGSPLAQLTKSSQTVLDAAETIMRASFCGRISTAHLLLALLEQGDVFVINTLLLANIDVAGLQRRVREANTTDGDVATPQRKFSGAVKRALERAKLEAYGRDNRTIEPRHLFSALLPRRANVSEVVVFGARAADPLEQVWPEFPTAEIRLQYEALRLRERRFTGMRGIKATEGCKRVVEAAYQLMQENSQSRITPAHLFLAILEETDSAAGEFLREAGCDTGSLTKAARDFARNAVGNLEPKRDYSPNGRLAMQIANYQALVQGKEFLDTTHLLVGLLALENTPRPGESIAQMLPPEQLQKLHERWTALAPPRDIGLQQAAQPRPPAKPWSKGVFALGASVFCASFLCIAVSMGTAVNYGPALTIFLGLLVLSIGFGAWATQTNQSPRLQASAMSIIFGVVLGALCASFAAAPR